MLTHAQAELLAFIDGFQRQNDGISPSFEEMKEAIGLKAKSGVHRLISALEERGKIRRIPNRARCLQVVPEASELEKYPSFLLVAELARRSEEARAAA